MLRLMPSLPSDPSQYSRQSFTMLCVANLPQDVAAQILDLIQAPPAGNPYKVLKDSLTTLYSLNDYQRFEALISFPLTGDQKPSHLMNRMLAILLDNYNPNFILCCLFLRSLPIKVHWHLLQEKISDPCALALKADELLQSRISSPVNLLAGQLEDIQVNAVATRTRPFLHPSILLHQLRLPVLHLLQVHVGTIRSTEIKLRTVGNLVWSWKTSSPAGGAPLPTCQFLQVES